MPLTRALALAVLALTFLPLPNWLPEGRSDPEYVARLADWALGVGFCAVAGLLAAYLHSVRRRRNSAPVRVAELESATLVPGQWFPVALAAAAFVTYAAIARWIFSGQPLLIDEIVSVLQAQMYAAGELTAAVREPREFFSILNVVDHGARTFGQYPVGGPLLLVPAVWLDATWLVGPLAGALCVWLFWHLLRHTDPLASRRWRRAAAALFAVAPFGAFMFGSHMNHTTTLLALLVAVVALPLATTDTSGAPRWGFVAGLALGIAATIRPLDAAAFALPAGAWLAWRARRGGPAVRPLLLAGLGVALPLAGLLAANAATTGHPLAFGYDVLWGSGHRLGFHESPWGATHTPARGLELLSLYFSRLSTYLFATPFPSILPAVAGLWLARSLSSLDRYLLASAGLLLVGYWAYWHDGYFLGPRFLFPLLPLCVLWTARAVPLLRDRLGGGSLAWRGVVVGGTVGIAYAVVTLAMVRIPSYRNGLTSMRYDAAAESDRAGVRDALVLVQESWGAQLVVRMWAAGISRPDAEGLYRSVDACVIEMTLRGIEMDGVRSDEALARLTPFVADSARLVSSDRSPDGTQRLLPGLRYPPLCEQRIAEDNVGYLHLAPWRLARDGNVYARWLPGREAEAASAFPGRPVYRLRRAAPEPGAPLVWERLHPDRAGRDSTGVGSPSPN